MEQQNQNGVVEYVELNQQRYEQLMNDILVERQRFIMGRERVRIAQRQNDTVCLFGTVTKLHGVSLWHGVSFWHGGSLLYSDKSFKLFFSSFV